VFFFFFGFRVFSKIKSIRKVSYHVDLIKNLFISN